MLFLSFPGHCMLMHVIQGVRPFSMTLMTGELQSLLLMSVGMIFPLWGNG